MKTWRALIASDEQRMQDIVAAVPGVVYQFVSRPGGEGKFTFLSAGVKDLLGLIPEEVYHDVGLITALVHPDDRQRITELALSAARRLGVWSFEFRLLLPGTGEKWVQSSARPKRLPGGGVVWNGVLLEIAGSKTAETDLRRFETRDRLTGLYNRSYFENQIARSDNLQSPTAIVTCDIDGLKLINDTFGHAEGNKLLIAAAKIIRASLKDDDLAARIGDDEFVSCCPALTTRRPRTRPTPFGNQSSTTD